MMPEHATSMRPAPNEPTHFMSAYDEDAIVIPDIYSQLELPVREVSLFRLQAELIYSILKQTGITKTLEVGFAYGCSAAHIISATDSPHYAIDPFQTKHWDNVGLKNLKTLKLDHHLRFLPDFAHNAMPALLKEGQRFDFILIDGDHRYDGIMNDFFYADKLLNEGGYVMFDDVFLRATQVVRDWILTNRADYMPIDLPNDDITYQELLLFQKVRGGDERVWDHFVEFYEGPKR
jgi:predicted O-methyltransferase YrrM